MELFQATSVFPYQKVHQYCWMPKWEKIAGYFFVVVLVKDIYEISVPDIPETFLEDW